MNIVNSLRSGGLVESLCTVKASFKPRTPLGLESCSDGSDTVALQPRKRAAVQ
jgi:hypothetical protein